jgi:hypothetical protein
MALTVMATVAVAPKLTRRSRLVMAIAPVKPHALTREQMLQNARNWLGVPYRLGGKNREGVDCSAFASVVVWQNNYYTTDLMYRIAHPISKENLKLGDALNIPEPGIKGHIYIFERWASEKRDTVWVYDASVSCGRVCHRPIKYDSAWVPVRYNWIAE